MADKRDKTISYRRASWFQGAHGLTLEKCIRDAHTALKSVDDRTIGYGGQLTKSAKQKNHTAGGLFLHLTVETPGEATSIVPHVGPTAPEVNLKTQKAPSNAEYLDADAFVFVHNDHVILCTTGIRDGAVAHFLYELFKKAKLRQDSIRFHLDKIADVTKLKMLHAQGVKEIELDAALFKATAKFAQRKSDAFGSLGAVGKFFKSLIDKPYDVTPDGLMVTVGLRIDRRYQKKISVGYKTIEDIAANAVKSYKENRRDRRLARNQNGKRKVVVVVRERGGNSVPAVFKSEAKAMAFLRSHVAHGTVLNADEASSWDELHKRLNTLNPRLAFGRAPGS